MATFRVELFFIINYMTSSGMVQLLTVLRQLCDVRVDSVLREADGDRGQSGGGILRHDSETVQ